MKNIFCSKNVSKFSSFDMKKYHLLNFLSFLRKIYGVFVFGTFFGLLFLLGTWLKIRTL